MADFDIIPTNSIEDNSAVNDPVIDASGCSFDPVKGIIIYNCSLADDMSFIEGYTEEGGKAKYIFNNHKWYYGHEISKLNFIVLDDLPEEQSKAIRSKGGRTRWENEKNKQTLNDIAKELLDTDMSDDSIEEVLGRSKKLLGDKRTAGAVMMVKMIQTAMAGSFKAAEFVRDTAGYKPKNEVDISADIMTDQDRSLLEKLEKRIAG